jgi:ATP-dependent Clp protease ATP-binding subunit ClpC
MEIKISQVLNTIIGFAREEAMRTGSYGISPDHLFLGILRHGNNNAANAIKDMDIDVQELKQFIDNKIFTNEHIPYSEIENITLSRGAQNVLNITILEATRLRTATADSQHLLLALCRITGSYSQTYLREHGIDYGRILTFMEKTGYLISENQQDENSHSNEHQPQQQEQTQPQEKEISIEDYGYDLTEAAQKGLLDPVVGRDSEIERVVEILGRRKKNNAMLVGDPGVGKSAIVEGIALKIASGNIPAALKNKKIISLDLASVVAGTRYRGDFEKRFKAIINELKNKPEIIVFIDEIHTIIGAGGASGSLDAANMMKPALARGEIQCIGATTMDEFTKVVEKDGALDRRFQKVVVYPADVPYSIDILKKIKFSYEQHHHVTYTDEAIEACAKLSDRYITDKCLPDKAIDALDEAGSMVRLRLNDRKKVSKEVTAEDVATVISKMSGIPVNKVAESEGHRLLKMKERLQNRIIGQDEAIDLVVKAIQRGRAGIKDPNRPIGSFLFFGPTGVGKTQLAKSIAEYLFDSQDNIIRIDMSEYMEKINVSRLIGAPPGYVGFEEGGQLSERVRKKPYCVVLLDEIEKAHPDVFNLLLQVIDEGRLTDNNGRTVNFKNTILIMTSNVGSREIEDYGSGIGFATSEKNISANKKTIVEKAVRKAFSPEFINRVDQQIFFNSLTKEDIEKIIDIELKDLRNRVLDAGFKISVTPSAKRFIAEEGYDPKFGARPLRRAIQKHIEDPVSEFIINARINGIHKQEDGLPTIRINLNRNKDAVALSLK